MSLRVIVRMAIVSGLLTSTAMALPPVPPNLKEALKNDNDAKKFLETFDGLKAKCDVCHKPGGDKKAKDHSLNDFGTAFHDKFDAKAFKEAVKDKKMEESVKLFKAAWEKAILEKNATGTVFAELIKAGKFPGKND